MFRIPLSPADAKRLFRRDEVVLRDGDASKQKIITIAWPRDPILRKLPGETMSKP